MAEEAAGTPELLFAPKAALDCGLGSSLGKRTNC